MNGIPTLRNWRIWTLDTEPPSEGRQHQKVCLNLIFDIQRGNAAQSVTLGQLGIFARDIRTHRSEDEVFLDRIFPDADAPALPHDDAPDGDNPFWMYLEPVTAMEAVVGEEECTLTVRYDTAEHENMFNSCKLSRIELMNMAADIKTWIAPDADF